GGEREIGRGALPPVDEGGALRQPIERGVQLHGGEPFGVELQPPPRGHPRRIEPVAPMTVLPTAGPDHDHWVTSGGPWPWTLVPASGLTPLRTPPPSGDRLPEGEETGGEAVTVPAR